MKILSKVAHFKRHFFEDSLDENSSNLASDSDSKLLARPEREKSQVNSSTLQQPTHSMSTESGGEIVPVQWSPAMKSVLEEPPSSLPLRLIAGGTAFFLLFGIWAWFSEIDKMGKAQGKLVPRGDSYKIESLQSAKITHIAVEEGEEVKAGQLIAKLDSEQDIKEVNRLKNQLTSHQNELAQKRLLLEKVKVEANTHKLIAKAEVQAQQSAIDSAIAAAEVNSQLVSQRESELIAYKNRQKDVKDLSALDREKLDRINSELADHQQRVERLKPLAEQGAISQEFIFQAQQAQRQAQQQLIDSKLQGISNINEQIFQSEQSLRDMETRITQSQGELVSARQEIERLQAELEYKKAERQRIELEAQQKIQQLELEIGQTKSQINETKSLLAIAQNQLDKKSLVAPISGTILSFDVVNTGEVVQPGETIAEIAPQNAPLVLSAFLPNREAGFVEVGMQAQVKLDAYSYQDYGVIPGKVTSVSTDSETDEQLGAGYRVKIELERNYVTEDLKKIMFKPGQTASADIVIRRRRVIDVLLDPIKKLEQDGIEL